MFFVGLPHLATYIILISLTNEPELGAGIDPGMGEGREVTNGDKMTSKIKSYNFHL
jgi:hypothetical protein